MADLTTLRDIHLPPEPQWWPPAIGWWLLVVAVLVFVASLPWLKRAAHRFAERQRALSQFRQIRRRITTSSDSASMSVAIADLSKLLRSVAHRRVRPMYRTTLTGKDWLQFLTDTGDGTDFSEQPGCYLAEVPYQRQIELDKHRLADLLPIARHWLKRHA